MFLTIKNITYHFAHNKYFFDAGQNIGHDFVLYKTIHNKNHVFIKKTIEQIRVLRRSHNYVEADKLRNAIASMGVTLGYGRGGHIICHDWRKRYSSITILRIRWVPTEDGVYGIINFLGLRIKWRKKRTMMAAYASVA